MRVDDDDGGRRQTDGSAEVLAELRSAVREALEEMAPLGRTLELMETGRPDDPTVWTRLSRELALPGIAIPEEYGGQGFGAAEQGAVLEELGRVLYGGPYLSSAVLTAGALRIAGDQGACARWLPGLSDGSRLGALAIDDGALPTTATPDDAGGVRLDGRKVAVIDGVGADLLVVPVRSDGAPVLAVVETPAAGLSIAPVPVMDLTRRLATVTFDGVPAHLLRPVRPDAPLAIRRLLASALASEQAGAARGALDATVEYARTRVQFGREIGSFQAVRHRLADLYAEVEIATAAARAAAACDDLTRDDAAVLVETATSIGTETFLTTSEEMVQLHGGIGFTWEHPAHLFLKRAKSGEILVGGAEAARARLHDVLVSA